MNIFILNMFVFYLKYSYSNLKLLKKSIIFSLKKAINMGIQQGPKKTYKEADQNILREKPGPKERQKPVSK